MFDKTRSWTGTGKCWKHLRKYWKLYVEKNLWMSLDMICFSSKIQALPGKKCHARDITAYILFKRDITG